MELVLIGLEEDTGLPCWYTVISMTRLCRVFVYPSSHVINVGDFSLIKAVLAVNAPEVNRRHGSFPNCRLEW